MFRVMDDIKDSINIFSTCDLDFVSNRFVRNYVYHYHKGGKKMKQTNVRVLVEGGMMIAVATLLSYIKVFEMPQGGSITAVSMAPILIYSCRHGMKKGLLVSTVYGILQFILQGGFSLHPLSILLDYVLAFAMLGTAGFLRGGKWQAVVGSAVAIALRYIVLVISGVVVWGSYAPEGVSPLRYSIGYNASYMIPEGILTLIFIAILYRKVIQNID